MIELKLDTNALSSLIDKDETFKLQLQGAVLANIADRYLTGTTVNHLRRAIEDVGKQERDVITKEYLTYKSNGWSTQVELNPKIAAEVKAAMAVAAKTELAAIYADIRDHVKAEIAKKATELDAMVARQVQIALYKRTTEAVALEIKTRVDAALKQIAG